MGRYDGQIDPPVQDECPECEQMHHYRESCPDVPLAQTKVNGIGIVTSEVQRGHWHTVICGGTWDCVAGDHTDREEALTRHFAVAEWLADDKCRGADDEPDCSHCSFRP